MTIQRKSKSPQNAGIFCNQGYLAARTALFHGTGFVDRDAAATHVGSVEFGDGLFCSGIISHFDERETARAMSFAVHRNEHGNDFAELGEKL